METRWKEQGQRKDARRTRIPARSVVNRDVSEDTTIGVGHKEAQCWFEQVYTKSNPPQDPLQRDIREWTNPAEKGQGHNQSTGQRDNSKKPGKGNQNQDKAESLDEEAGQRSLDDFGMKRQRVELVGDVQEHSDELEMPKVDRAVFVFCVHNCKRCQVRRGELFEVCVQGSEEPAGTHEMKPEKSTGEVFLAVGCRDDRRIAGSGSVVSTCPVGYATSVPTRPKL